MRTLHYKTELCVIGGGMAGLCCAIAAARHGVKTVLINDRHVLGGNASEEIRMQISGAKGKDNRETGILEEIVLENHYQNTGLKFPVWSSVLYEKAKAEENITLLLGASCLDADMDGSRIKKIKAWQSNAETFHEVEAEYFADCSGDSVLAELTGAEFMYGREAKSDFNETIAPDKADKKTMGSSCLFEIRETDHKVEFTPPSWAHKYEKDEDLPYKDQDKNTNFWWIETGGDGDCLYDVDNHRDDLLKICYGVFDHMKNYGDHGLDNWELDWIGFLPGKRETRRYKGKYIVTQNDVEAEGRFPDIVAYGGWPMDDHFPEGFYYSKGYQTIFHPAPSPWGLPLRCLISNNIDNLVFAGRNISVTHAALSSSRVMATCAMLGQALGTAVAEAISEKRHISEIDVHKLQQTLMEDDCYIPWHERKLPPLTLKAKCSAEIVRNGKERAEENCWIGKKGDVIEYDLGKDTFVSEIRLVFDSDLNRGYHNMPTRFYLNESRYKMPTALIKAYRIEAEDENGNVRDITVSDNRKRFVRHKTDFKACKIRLIPLETYGNDEMRVFDFEVK